MPGGRRAVQGVMRMRKITETKNFYPLGVLFRACGLEIDDLESPPEGTLAMWRCEDESGALLGGANLKRLKGCYILDNLAVQEDLRGNGIGLALMETALEEAKANGAKEIWGCAKVPEYYLSKGWISVPPEETPEIFHCQTCGQFGVSCFPVIIKKEL